MLNRYAIRSCVLALALLATACRESTGPGDRVTANLASDEFAVTTADSAFVLRLQQGVLVGRIPFDFTNVSNQTVSVPNCNGGYRVVLERWHQDGWQYAWSGAQLGCLAPAIQIAPGETLPGSFGIYAGYGEARAIPLFPEGPVAGTYRIVIAIAYWDYVFARNTGTLLPERLRISNEFTIRVE